MLTTRLRSSLRATPRGITLHPNPQNGECGRSSRAWFVYVGPRAGSVSHPAARIPCRSRARPSLYCVLFPKSRHLRRRPWILILRGRVFVAWCIFLQCIFAGSLSPAHSAGANLRTRDVRSPVNSRPAPRVSTAQGCKCVCVQ